MTDTAKFLETCLGDMLNTRAGLLRQIEADKVSISTNEDTLIRVDTMIASLRVNMESDESVAAVANMVGRDESTLPKADILPFPNAAPTEKGETPKDE